MKGKIIIELSILLMFSALTFCIFAQTQRDTQQGDIRKAQQNIDKLQQEKQNAVHDTLLIDGNAPKKGMTLFLGIAEDGKLGHAVVLRPNSSVSNIQKLRIEMQDGSVQEIIINKIKKLTVQ